MFFDKLTQAGWAHQDGDEYVTEGVARLECSASMPGESHGICDGFGTCQCSPPFIGDDCSTKVCLSVRLYVLVGRLPGS